MVIVEWAVPPCSQEALDLFKYSWKKHTKKGLMNCALGIFPTCQLGPAEYVMFWTDSGSLTFTCRDCLSSFLATITGLEEDTELITHLRSPLLCSVANILVNPGNHVHVASILHTPSVNMLWR